MVDKMMRVAGRGEDGRSTPFLTSYEGVLKTSASPINIFDENQTIPRNNGSVETEMYSSRGYSMAGVHLAFNSSRRYRVKVSHYGLKTNGEYILEKEETVFGSTFDVGVVNFEIDLIESGYFKLTIENGSEFDGSVGINSTISFYQNIKANQNKSVIELAYNNTTIPAKNTELITFQNAGFKDFMIHFYANSNQDLSNSIIISSYGGQVGETMFRLPYPLISSYQPIIDFNGTVSRGATPMIPMLSPHQAEITLENTSLNDITLRYGVVGFR